MLILKQKWTDGEPIRIPRDLSGGLSILTATPVEQTWMWLNWSELYSFQCRNEIPPSYGIYKIVDSDSGELLLIGSAKNLRSAFQTQARKNWQCPGPAFAYSLLSDTLLPHHIHEIENDLLGGYFAYAKVTPKSQGKSRQNSGVETAETVSDGGKELQKD